MKKIIAVTMVALMMLAVATSAFALVTDTTASYKNPPVFISGMTVSDAWMSGLTAQNWAGPLTNQAYAEGSYIWFIARISVAAEGDTDAAHLWNLGSETATLTITGKDNCLNFSSANMATLAQISGMSVTARQIQNNNLGIVEAVENKAKFIFSATSGTGVDENGVVLYANKRLENLQLDAIYPKNAERNNARLFARAIPTNAPADINNRATLQKDFYLHFMAITKASTEGVCIGTLKVNGTDTFKRQQSIEVGQALQGAYATAGNWWAPSGSSYTGTNSDTKLLAGDRSEMHLLYNTVNGKHYSVMKIKNEPVVSWAAIQAAGTLPGENWDGPGIVTGSTPPEVTNAQPLYDEGGYIYVVMDAKAEKVICGFVVDSTFKGLAQYNKNAVSGGAVAFNPNTTGRNSGYYMTLASNDLSNASVILNGAYNGYTLATGELQQIFDFFGFAYANSRAPGDADFLARSGLVTVAEAKYNVANAVITTPDNTIVIPKTGDAATSTGLILVASAILAAAAVGFVLSKRAHN